MNDKNLGELELIYIEKMKARSGGITIIFINAVLLGLAALFSVNILMILFAITELFWIMMVWTIHSQVIELRELIKIRLGISE